MIKFLLFGFLTLSCNVLVGQGTVNYYILSDNAKAYSKKSLASQVIMNLELGYNFQSPVYVSAEWIGFEEPHLDDTVFISKKVIGFESDFLNEVKKRPSLNGRAKYELLKIKLHNDDYTGSKDLLLDILNNHREYMNDGSESCDQLNVLALELYFNGYPNSIQLEQIKRVISAAKDKNIKAMANCIALRYSILKGQKLLSEFYIKQIIAGELKNLFLKGCDYSTYFSTQPLIEAKKVIASFFIFNGKESCQNIMDFIESQVTEEPNLKSDFCKDLLKIMNDGNYDQHWDYKSK